MKGVCAIEISLAVPASVVLGIVIGCSAAVGSASIRLGRRIKARGLVLFGIRTLLATLVGLGLALWLLPAWARLLALASGLPTSALVGLALHTHPLLWTRRPPLGGRP